MASSWGLVGNGALWQAIVDMVCLALSSKQCRYVRFLYGAGLAIGKCGEGGCTVRVLSGADVVPAIRAADGMDDTDFGGHGSILNERAKKVFPILGSMGQRLLYGGDGRLLSISSLRQILGPPNSIHSGVSRLAGCSTLVQGFAILIDAQQGE